MNLRIALVPLLVLMACDPSPSDSGDDNGDPAEFKPASVPAPPQVVDSGGPVLDRPKVAAFVFAGDPLAALVDAFLPQLQPSGYWTLVTAEYGVGALAVSPTVELTVAAPAQLTGDELVTQLGDGLDAGLFGPADPATIYMAVIPDGTTLDDFGECCFDFDGEHFPITYGTDTLAMAVVCSCPGFDGPDVSNDDQLTTVISHELTEAATDPFDDLAFAVTDDDHVAWTIMSGGEIADLCDLLEDSITSVPGIDFGVQRIWSNDAAKHGRDPCLPAPEGAFFQSVPVLDDNLTVDDGFGTTVQTLGKQLAVGETGTIQVKLSSSAEVAAWNVDAYDATFDAPLLDLQLDKSSGKNGDTLTLTVTLLDVDPSIGGALFVIDSYNNVRSSIAVGLVAP